MRRLALALCALLLLPAAPAAGDASLVAPYSVCPADACAPEEMAKGLVAAPAAGEPLALVVILHGYGHTAQSHRAHLQHLAEQGYLAVAMDFRGTGFPLRAGADDTLAATEDLLARHPVDLVVLYSVSMGTAVAAMVLAETDVFDYWVNNEGLSMLHETWAGASALAPVSSFAAKAKADIEKECEGSPAVAPACYVERSAALRAQEFSSNLKGAVLTHGVVDGIVPYTQGREMVAALRAVGVPSDFHTVVRGADGGEGTTLTTHAGFTPPGFAGHGTESNDAHTMTWLSFGLLDQLLAGALVPADRELVVDRDAPALP